MGGLADLAGRLAIAVAVLVYGMPIGQALLAGTEGAAFGFFPILWIVINAIWVYQMTVETGHFDVLRRSFSQVSDDQRIQAIIIAFSFGALLEALAGFGTPVAVTSVMLMALGFKPMKAAALALVANTAPVAFGAMATPIITLGKVTELPADTLGAMVGRQTPLLALFVPLVLVAIVDGRRGIRETWPVAVVCGARVRGRAVRHVELRLGAAGRRRRVPAVGGRGRRAGAGLAAASRPYTEPAVVAGGAADEPTAEFAAARRASGDDTRADVVKAYAPYGIIIAVFVVCQIGAVKKLLDKATVKFHWPGLHVVSAEGKPVTLTEFTLNLLTTPGTQMLIAGVLTVVALRLSVPRALKAYGTTLHQLRWAILTVMAVLALAFVMNLSGQTITLGTWMAGGGRSVRAAVADPRLARRGGHRIRHLGQLAVRRAAGDRRESGRAVRHPDGRVQQFRRRARQDDLAAEPRHRRRRGRPERQGRRHLPPGRGVEPAVPRR